MLVEEHRDHLLAMGEEPQPIDWRAIAMNALINALFIGAAGVMFALGREWEWEIAFVGAGLLGLLYGVWRRMNAPEPDPFGPPETTIPAEAVYGFAGAIALVGAVVAALVLLV